MNLLKSFGSLLIVTLGLTFASCDDDRNEVIYNTIQVPEQLFADGYTSAPTGESYTFYVNSSTQVTAHAEKINEDDNIKWVEVEVGSRTSEGYPVTVTTELNETRGPRSARISVYATNVARAFTLTQPTNAPTVLAETPINDVTAKQIASRMYAGINIGNTLEAPDGEGSWTRSVTIEYIRGLKAAGFNAVRIPCAWDSHISGKTAAEKKQNIIDPDWLERIDQVVEWVVGEDMYAIVNIHWDGGWLEESCVNGYNADVDKKQKDFWTQIAKKLNHYDEHLLFAGMNEPGQQNQGGINESSIDAIMTYQQTFVDAVRATGGNNASRVLIHQTPCTSIDRGVSSNYSLPNDIIEDRAMLEVHFYDPYQFVMMETDESWGKILYYWGSANHVEGSDRNCPASSEESMVISQFDKIKQAYVANGVPAIVGEYAVTVDRSNNADNPLKWAASRDYWTEVVTREAKNHGLVPFFWETGSEIDRTNGNVLNQSVVNAIMQGASAGTYPF